MAVKKEAVITEEKKLHDYELVFVISPKIEDDTLESTITNISQFITGKGGNIADVERWGKKKLAYPLKKFLEGTYVLARFQMNPEYSKELEASLHISEDVLRHLLINVES